MAEDWNRPPTFQLLLRNYIARDRSEGKATDPYWVSPLSVASRQQRTRAACPSDNVCLESAFYGVATRLVLHEQGVAPAVERRQPPFAKAAEDKVSHASSIGYWAEQGMKRKRGYKDPGVPDPE
jgi:hypothetical protein